MKKFSYLVLFFITVFNIVLIKFIYEHKKEVAVKQAATSSKIIKIPKPDNITSPPLIIVKPEEKVLEPSVKKEIKPPCMVIIIDDIGQSLNIAKKIWSINKNITLSILPFYEKSRIISLYAKKKKLPVMLHLPMEPHSQLKNYDFFLKVSQSKKYLKKIIEKNLNSIPFYIGINNHMGSKFTENEEKLKIFFDIIKNKNIFFIDSLTTRYSVADKVSYSHGIVTGVRDVFIDNVEDVNYILSQLKKAEKIAIKSGFSIAIGHPHKETILALKIFINQTKVNIVNPADGLKKFKNIEKRRIFRSENEYRSYRYRY